MSITLRASSFACSLAVLVAAGCTPAPVPLTCEPACATGFRCDSTTGQCVSDGTTVDMAAGGGGDMPAATCNPPCAMPTPFCNANKQCVACLADKDCQPGNICKTTNLGAACVPGCVDDARCPNGQKCCNAQCVDPTKDVNNCGACGKPCAANHARPTCAAGVCKAGACDPGWGDCNGDGSDGCETNLRVDANNCTMCGMKCAIKNAIVGCSDGCYIKACQFGFDDCNADPKDGCETSVLSDAKNCGACGKNCSAPPHAKAQCLNAQCAVTSCDVGWTDCDNNGLNGCETQTGTDAKNCGACGNVCAQGLVCQNGGCTCPQCNIPNAKSACVNNMCVLDSCLPGYADCDKSAANGCEVYLAGDAKNCGACGNACPMNMPFCSMSQCTLINNKVLLVYASTPAWAQEVQAGLQATGDFQVVDLFNASSGTPTLAQMQPYGAIMFFSDSGFSDPTTLGNNAADYYDQGGQVVVATFANASVPIQGRFGTVGNGYMLIQPAGQDQPNDSLGQILEPNSPLVAGVSKLSAQAAYRSSGGPINGGVVVAQWASGKPLIVRGVVKGRNRADVNMYPPSSKSRADFWSGDGTRIMRNALLYR